MASRWTRVVTATVLLLAGLAPPASADPQSDQVRAACMGDYRRFCFGTMPGGGRIVACLSEHTAELAPPCAQAVAMGQACVEDFKKYCATVSPQSGELKRCLQEQGAKLSPSCTRALATTR